MALVPIIFRFVPEMVTLCTRVAGYEQHIIDHLKTTTIDVFSRASTQKQVEEVLPLYASHIVQIEIAEKYHRGTDGVTRMTANLYVNHNILGVLAPVGAAHIYDDVDLSVDIFSNHTNGADRRFTDQWHMSIRDFNGLRTGLIPDRSKRSRKTSQTRGRTRGGRTATADVEAGTRRSSSTHGDRNTGGRSFSTYAPGTYHDVVSSGFTGSGQMYPVGSIQPHGPVFAGHQPQPGNPMAPVFASYGNVPGMMPSQSHTAGGFMPHGQHVNATPGPSQHMGHVAPGAVLPPGPFYGQRNQGIGMPMQYAQPGTAYPVPVFTSQQPPQLYGRDMTQEQWDAMRRAGWSANTASGGASSSGASSSNIRGQGR